MLFTPATEFKERVLKTGAWTIFSVLSSAIFKSYGLPLHTLSLFSVLPSPFSVPRSTFFVLRSSFPVPGFSNFPCLVALIQWEFFWGLPLNSKWVGKITVFTRFPVITREATWKKKHWENGLWSLHPVVISSPVTSLQPKVNYFGIKWTSLAQTYFISARTRNRRDLSRQR